LTKIIVWPQSRYKLANVNYRGSGHSIQIKTYLLACIPWPYPSNIDNIPLHHTDIREMFSIQRFQLFTLSFFVLLLLVQTLDAKSMLHIRCYHLRAVCTHSSGFTGLNWTASSEYFLLHAGHLPFKFSLMWYQQKRQILNINNQFKSS
jgi:hypothetical protein